MTKRKNLQRRIWEKYNGEIPKDEYGRTMEIHHIDGNHNNNDIQNLKLVTIEEHYKIHYEAGDWFECFLIATQRMNKTPEEISNLSRKTQEEKLKNGTHIFLNSAFQSKISKQTNAKRVAQGTHNFLGKFDRSKTKAAQDKMLSENTHPFQTNHNSRIIWTCEYCGTIGKSSTNYSRWHGKRCKAYDQT